MTGPALGVEIDFAHVVFDSALQLVRASDAVSVTITP